MNKEEPTEKGSSPLWREEERPSAPASKPSTGAVWREEEKPGTGPTPTAPIQAKTGPTVSGGTSDGVGGDGAPPSRSSRGRRQIDGKLVRRSLFLALALIVLLLVADGMYAAGRVRSELQHVASSAQQGREALGAGELEDAEEAFLEVRRHAVSAQQGLRRPALKLISLIPFAENDIEVADSISEASAEIARAGRKGVQLARELGISDEGLAASLYTDGTLQLDEIEAARPHLAAIARTLGRAQADLTDAPRALLSSVRGARDEALGEITSSAQQAQRGSALFTALPEVLGGQGPRSYLLAFQALGEARGTGGVIGLYGSLRADDGRLSLGRIGPYTDIIPTELDQPVEAPDWFEDSYGPQFALREWQQANSSPNFPAVAEVLLEMHALSGGKDLDGVIAMDPIAMQTLMKSTGPLSVGKDEIAPAEIDDVLLKDSYLRFKDQDKQNAYLGELVNSFWNKIRDGEFDATELASGLATTVSTRHLMIFSQNDESQDVMRDLDATGEYAPDGELNTQMVFHNNYSVNKIDIFLKRAISTEVVLDEQGVARVRTSIRMANNSPEGPPSLLLGPGVPGDEPGLNRMLFNVLAPVGSAFDNMELDQTEIPLVQFQDDLHPVAWHVMEIPSGNTSVVSLTYRIPNAVSIATGEPTFDFRLVPQPLALPDRYKLSVQAPPGYELSNNDGSESTIRRFTAEGTLERPYEISFRLVPSGQ